MSTSRRASPIASCCSPMARSPPRAHRPRCCGARSWKPCFPGPSPSRRSMIVRNSLRCVSPINDLERFMRYVFPRRFAATFLFSTALVSSVLGQSSVDTLPPVVVTATRVPAPRDALSTMVTVLRGDDLVARGITTVADALRSVAAATVVQTGSFGGVTSLFLRGGESDYVKVLLDGVPLNQPGGAFDFSSLTTDNVDRVEIVRGPASVLYGSDAVTGVVQIFTRRGAGGSGAGQAVATVRGG